MSKQLFKENPSLDSYFETSDGNKFYKEHDAKAYAKKLKDRKVTEVGRDSLPSLDTDNDLETDLNPVKNTDKKPAKLTSEERIAAIEKMINVADIEVAIKGEKAKTVLAAADKRIAEIMATDALDKKDDPNVTQK